MQHLPSMNRLKKGAGISNPSDDHAKLRRVLIVAGEASADLHGANLVRAMKDLDPGATFCGIGGKNMEEAGVRNLFTSSDMAVVGITEVFAKARLIYKASRTLKSILKHRRPDLLILIDYPDFNINLARTAKRCGVPVLYYISPQVWAWRVGRVRKIARRVDRMAVILPFEEDFYRQRGVTVEYVGHPLLDAVPEGLNKTAVRREMNIGRDDPVLAVLPGSRGEEVRNLLPVMTDAAEMLTSRLPGLKCIIPVAPTISPETVRAMIRHSPLDIRICHGETYRVLAASDLCFVASGTATLEAGILGVPMVIVYRVSPMSFWIAKRVVRVDRIGLVNLVTDTPFVPELVQNDVTARRLSEEALAVLEGGEARENMLKGFRDLKEKLGTGTPSGRTAEIALDMMNQH